MGREETSSSFIGAVTTLVDLMNDIGEEKTFYLLKNQEVVVLDENNHLNERLNKISNGEIDKEKFNAYISIPVRLWYDKSGHMHEDLGENELALKNEKICIYKEMLGSCSRWGYNRCGVNAASSKLSDLINLKEQIEAKMKIFGIRTFVIELIQVMESS